MGQLREYTCTISLRTSSACARFGPFRESVSIGFVRPWVIPFRVEGRPRGRFGAGSGLVWGRVGIGLGSVEDRFGFGLDLIWGRFGTDLGSVWGRFDTNWDSF